MPNRTLKFADHTHRFLLPRLHLDRLGCQTSIRNLRKALDALPTKLNETYDEAMIRIQGQVQEHSQLALSALAWISNALRPLILDELKEALAIQPGDPELDEEAIPEEALIVSVSAGLITIDPESETIRLVHFTVEEYFKGSKHQWFPDAQSRIAKTCLTYLSFNVFETGECRSREDYIARLNSHRLLEYATINWGLHASRAEHAISHVASAFLLDKKKASCAGQILLQKDTTTYIPLGIVPYDFTGLHLAAYFGLASLAKRYLEAEPVVNPEDRDGRTPLSWAAKKGHTAVVQLLLDRDDVVADSQDNDRRTPLSWAAAEGHTAVVQLLLNRDDVVADSQNKWGRTPLSLAAAEGHMAVVKLLLDRDDVVADSQDRGGHTPLSWAAEKGHTAIVQLLLNWDNVLADSKDENGCTPLVHAIKYGRKETVRLLLDRDDVAADYQDHEGQTPLDHATRRREGSIVKLLKKKLGDEEVSESSESVTSKEVPLWDSSDTE